ncbi:hypothetical protein [Chelatococcus composti]|uniref:Glutelin n=1 Tax=Chelatococcus composti TaxID=1743235 RepID=A0A841KBY4_9HYPH|nr:hypothetical protein [Chelatococcus composti]MBB6168902.1 hypothetical protein [Chelatococcus composti]MBS7737507.1 hypothetical protein [Chelatococcus composti]GGG43800.1 hypothetical protein GCM10008026_25850 [Chelatococcus composti]
MRNTLLSATTLGAALLFGTMTARAADFVCPDLPGSAQTKTIQDLLGSVDPLDRPDQLNAAVDALNKAGVSRAMIIDQIIAAYCPSVAANKNLTPLQKTLRIQRVAAEVSRQVYNITSEEAVLVSVPLPPDTLDKIGALAKQAGVTPAEWIAGVVEAATGR